MTADGWAGLRIATAGWTIPRAVAGQFPSQGATLTRYAARFDAVEINSTFYRGHRASTYARWAAATPEHFRFALKLPRAITHEARLVDAAAPIAAFRAETEPLEHKRGPLLVQLPPSLAFDPQVAARFFEELHKHWPGPAVCEPRHPSWFEPEADQLLSDHRIGRVAADPARHLEASSPGGWRGLAYWRLHGSPRMYFSAYDEARLLALAAELRAQAVPETWCVFDNTASGAAAGDALGLHGMIRD